MTDKAYLIWKYGTINKKWIANLKYNTKLRNKVSLQYAEYCNDNVATQEQRKKAFSNIYDNIMKNAISNQNFFAKKIKGDI